MPVLTKRWFAPDCHSLVFLFTARPEGAYAPINHQLLDALLGSALAQNLDYTIESVR
jgi:hypothetical protein